MDDNQLVKLAKEKEIKQVARKLNIDIMGE